jgi:hypothetical protein
LYFIPDFRPAAAALQSRAEFHRRPMFFSRENIAISPTLYEIIGRLNLLDNWPDGQLPAAWGDGRVSGK